MEEQHLQAYWEGERTIRITSAITISCLSHWWQQNKKNGILATFQRCEKSMKNCIFCETEGCMNANNLLEAPSFRVGRPQFTLGLILNIFALSVMFAIVLYIVFEILPRSGFLQMEIWNDKMKFEWWFILSGIILAIWDYYLYLGWQFIQYSPISASGGFWIPLVLSGLITVYCVYQIGVRLMR